MSSNPPWSPGYRAPPVAPGLITSGPKGDPGTAGTAGANGAAGATGPKGDPGAGILSSTLAARPAASTVPGQIHYATDAGLPAVLKRSHSDGTQWRVDAPTYSLLDYGGDPTGAASSDAAWASIMANIAAAYPGAVPTIYVPPGTYRHTHQVDITRGCVIRGEGAGGSYALSRLQFPPGSAGLVIHSAGTAPDGGRSDFATVASLAVECLAVPVGPPAWQASHAYALGAVIRPTVHNRYAYVCTHAGTSGTVEPTWITNDLVPQTLTFTDGGATWQCQWADGIRAFCRARVERCFVSGFEGDGVHHFGNTSQTPESNVNGWQTHDTRIQQCNGHGHYAGNYDGNAGVGIAIDVDLSNPQTGLRAGMSGILDNSFISSAYFGCQVAYAGTHAYEQDNVGAATVFVGCYAEQGDGSAWPSTTSGNGPSRLVSKNTVVIDGFMGASQFTADTQATIMTAGVWNRVKAISAIGFVGLNDDNGASLFRIQGAAESQPLVIQYAAGIYSLSYAGLGSNTLMAWTGALAADGPGKIQFPVGFKSGQSTAARYVLPRGGYDRVGLYTAYAGPYAIGGGNTYDLASAIEFWGIPQTDYTITLAAANRDPVWIFNNNTTSRTATVSVAGQTGATVAIAPGRACYVAHDGVNCRRITPQIDPTA